MRSQAFKLWNIPFRFAMVNIHARYAREPFLIKVRLRTILAVQRSPNISTLLARPKHVHTIVVRNFGVIPHQKFLSFLFDPPALAVPLPLLII